LVNIKEHLYLLPAHSRLHHIYNTEYPIGSFNDSGFGERRFDPIFNADDEVIPTLYAAEHYIDTFAETLMRKNTNKQRLFTGDISQSGLLQFDTSKKLTLIDTSSISRLLPLLSEGNEAYPELQNFAKWLAVNHKKIHGITWYGYQREIEGHRCMMFFGDRLHAKNLIHRVTEKLITITATQKLKDAAKALNCVLPTNCLF
jgi:hypothetical protein